MTVDAWWAQVSAEVVSALIVTGVVGGVVLAVKPLRLRFFAFLRRLSTWVRSLRVTTTTRHAAIAAEAHTAAELAREQGRSEVHAEVAAERADVGIEPNWTVTFHEESKTFALTDTHWARDISDVRISTQHQEFRFDGATTWLGPFNARTVFDGETLWHGARHGVTFTVTWRDRNRDSHSAKTFIDPTF
jgi:hypothetical protein